MQYIIIDEKKPKVDLRIVPPILCQHQIPSSTEAYQPTSAWFSQYQISLLLKICIIIKKNGRVTIE